ncbi:HAD-IA family hydrolase [Sneathiella glossodoripedis]|uniref:HAD-IA family hydrolase n=1 Tax=Sneathiella glossodoripedis TaxID=418853 RepID=UPI00047185C1|nr:HAD-IA family hydrolase [Sneathiella glossodoripedis]
MSSSALKLVVFDCDGTLVDSQYNIIRCMNKSFEACDLTPPIENDIRNIIGLNLEEAIRMLMPNPADEPLLHQLVACYRDAFREQRLKQDHEEPLFPGALEVLEKLYSSNVLLAVATGKSMRGLKAVIKMHGLEKYFTSLQTPDQNPGKPHPQMLEKAMAEVGADCSNTYMVGDTSYDMLLARNAGCHAIGVGWGYHDFQTLEQSGANHLIYKYDDLPPLVGIE